MVQKLARSLGTKNLLTFYNSIIIIIILWNILNTEMCIGYIYVSKPVCLISIMFSISANISPYCLLFVKRSWFIHHKYQYVFHYDLLKGKYNCSAMTGEVLYWPWEGLMLFERCTTYSKKYGSQRKHLPLF